MNPAATIALRTALRDTLQINTTLASRLGGAGRIYDEVPRGIDPPYITLGDVRVRDRSTSTESGSEHTISLDIWSQHHGVHECLEIAALAGTALAQSTLVLPGHDLILLRLQSVETSRRDKGRLALARMRYVALTDDEMI